jgi:uncharacterized membrane protein
MTMERFPALDLVLRFGAVGSLVVSIAAAAVIIVVAWPSLGWLAAVVAVAAGALLFLVCKSFVEIVTIITEMLVPR